MRNTDYIHFDFDSCDESSQEEAFCEIFKPNLEQVDINDEINSDKLYFVEGKNKLNVITFEDFDEFYKNFAEINEQNETNNVNENENFEKPLFHININDEKIFSSFEDEKLFNVINQEFNKVENKDNINIKEDNFAKPLNIKKKNNDQNYFFPFTQGKGLINGNFSFKQFDDTILENSINSELVEENENNCYELKFTTKKYCIINGKKRREKKKRKFKSDDIRKKIKSRFHKTIKNIINGALKKAGAKKLFDFLPQCFIGNVSKKINSTSFELTYYELLSTDFINNIFENNRTINKKVDYKKFLKNKEVLEYLEENPEIEKNSGFDLIKNKKYKDLLKIYFLSNEFENSIIRLKEENEENDYIQEYFNRAKQYVEFYSNIVDNEKNESNDE